MIDDGPRDDAAEAIPAPLDQSMSRVENRPHPYVDHAGDWRIANRGGGSDDH
jgi:hypothetical protein